MSTSAADVSLNPGESQSEVEIEARMREILGEGWTAPRTDHEQHNYAALRDEGDVPWIAKVGPYWQFAGAHVSRGAQCISSVDADGIKLAERLAAMVKPDEAAYGGGHEEAIEDHGEAGDEAVLATDGGGVEDALHDAPAGPDGPDDDGMVGNEIEAREADAEESANADDFDLGELEDYTLDPPALEGAEPTDADFSEPEPDEAASQFIFGDGLYQMRVAAIGLVTVKAASLMPDVDLVRLSELRNFAMGVSEKRWDDDAAKREELDTLEATARLANAIAKARDDKAAYLLDATREQVEAFDVEANWP